MSIRAYLGVDRDSRGLAVSSKAKKQQPGKSTKAATGRVPTNATVKAVKRSKSKSIAEVDEQEVAAASEDEVMEDVAPVKKAAKKVVKAKKGKVYSDVEEVQEDTSETPKEKRLAKKLAIVRSVDCPREATLTLLSDDRRPTHSSRCRWRSSSSRICAQPALRSRRRPSQTSQLNDKPVSTALLLSSRRTHSSIPSSLVQHDPELQAGERHAPR